MSQKTLGMQLIITVLAALLGAAGAAWWFQGALEKSKADRTQVEQALQERIIQLEGEVARLSSELALAREQLTRATQKRNLLIYGADADAMRVIPRFEIEEPQGASLLEKLELLAGELSGKMFRNLPIVVLGVEAEGGKKIAHFDLREDAALGEADWRNSWKNTFFQGTSGGAMTTGTLVKTFLQEEYPGEWVDGVRFTYQGAPINEDMFDHVGLNRTYRRKGR